MSAPSHLLHFVTSEATSLGQIRAAATLRGVKGLPRRPFRVFHSHAIVIVLEGSGFYEDAAGRSGPLKAGDAVWVLPTLGQAYGADPGTVWDEFFVEFSGSLFDRLIDQASADSTSLVFPSLPPSLRAAFLEFAHRPQASGPAGRMGAMAEWLALLVRLLATRLEESSASWESHAKARLDARLSSPDVIQLVAKELKLSPESFRRRFTLRCGVSPARYVAERRLDEAALMISQTQLTLASVASALGFCDAFHLSRQYRKRFGESPSASRDTRKNSEGVAPRES